MYVYGISSDIVSDILSGIYSDILSGILPGIYSDMCSDLLSGILSDIPFDSRPCILSGIYSDIPSGVLSDICSDIFYLALLRAIILAFFLAFAFVLAFILAFYPASFSGILPFYLPYSNWDRSCPNARGPHCKLHMCDSLMQRVRSGARPTLSGFVHGPEGQAHTKFPNDPKDDLKTASIEVRRFWMSLASYKLVYIVQAVSSQI